MDTTHQQIEYYYIKNDHPCGAGYEPPLACVCLIRNTDGTFSRGISVYSAPSERAQFNKKRARELALAYAVGAEKANGRQITAYILNDYLQYVLDVAKNHYGLDVVKYWLALDDEFEERCRGMKDVMKGTCWPPAHYIVDYARFKLDAEGVGAYYKGRAGFTSAFLTDYEKKILDVK